MKISSTLAHWYTHWEDQSLPEWTDYRLLVACAVIFPIVRYLLDRFIFQVVGTIVIANSKPAGHTLTPAEKEAAQKTLVKFKESAWKLTYFLTAEAFCLAITYNEPWFGHTKSFWVGPGDNKWPNQPLKFKLKALYAFSGGFYTYSIFALLFWETRRKDFGVSMSHHVATVILIIFSYIAKLYRAGSIVLAVHDASDVFLEIAKLSKYGAYETAAEIGFALFALSWVLLRLIYFPFFIIWSTTIEVVQVLDKDDHKVEGPLYYYLFNSLQIMLLVLHIYWWVLIWRMIKKQFQSGRIEKDERSDSEDEHED